MTAVAVLDRARLERRARERLVQRLELLRRLRRRAAGPIRHRNPKRSRSPSSRHGGVARGDVVAELVEKLRRLSRRQRARLLDGVGDRRLDRPRDAQPPRVHADLRRERPCRRGDPRRVAGLVPRRDVEERGGVPDRPRERAVLRERERPFAVRRGRDPSARRLQPEEPAARGRDADRPAAVASRARAGGRRRRRARRRRRSTRPASARGSTGSGTRR